MLLGTFTHSLDSKGRLIVPAGMREDLGDHFYLCMGMDERSLYFYSSQKFQEFASKLLSLSSTDKNVRRFKENFFSLSSPADIDSQGRIVVTKELREHAGLSKDVLIRGAGDYAVLTASERIQPSLTQEELDELTLALSERGL